MASLTFEPLLVPLREDEQGAIRVGDTRVLVDLVIHAFTTVRVQKSHRRVLRCARPSGRVRRLELLLAASRHY